MKIALLIFVIFNCDLIFQAGQSFTTSKKLSANLSTNPSVTLVESNILVSATFNQGECYLHCNNHVLSINFSNSLYPSDTIIQPSMTLIFA